MGSMSWNHIYTEINNITLHYVRHGEGFPLILLHGWPEFWYTWRKNIPVLADSFDVIAPDLRGFGKSEKPAGTATEAYTLEHHMNDLLCLLESLQLNRIGIVSHDIGAMVAHLFARRHPDRVTGLFFFDIPYPGIGARQIATESMNEIWYQGFHQQPWAAELVGASRDTARIYFRNILAHWAQDEHVFEEDLETWLDTYLEPGNLQGGFNWYSAIFPLRIAMIRGESKPIPAIDTPTCVRWGENEPFMKVEYADRLGEYFTNLDFKSVPNAGHFVHYQQPEYINRTIKTFFNKIVENKGKI